MKKIIIGFVILTHIINVYGQSNKYFEKFYEWSTRHFGGDILIVDDDQIAISSPVAITNGVSGSSILYVDQKLNEQNYLVFKVDSGYHLVFEKLIKDSISIIQAGYLLDTSTYKIIKGVIQKIDKEGTKLNKISYRKREE